MSIDAAPAHKIGAGHLIARRLRASGIDTIFTLSGGHLFSIYDGCRAEGIRLIDTRHEQTAAFAAEGWSKVTRVPGVAALTAGPGVTNGMSAMARRPAEPVAAARARRPGTRAALGAGFAAGDRPRAVRGAADPVRRHRAVGRRGRRAHRRRAARGHRRRAPSGVAFVDFPMDHVFGEADDAGATRRARDPAGRRCTPTATRWRVAAGLLAGAQRPVIMAGTNVWWGHAEAALLRLAEALRIPVLMNGMARGAVPADHELAFSRARGQGVGGGRRCAGRRRADGFPAGLRRGVRGQTQPDRGRPRRPERAHPRPVAAELYGDLSAHPDRARRRAGGADHEDWIARAAGRREHRAATPRQAELTDDRSPLHPMRVYAELKPLLDRDAIVVDRRRRLRFLRGPGDRQLRAGRVAGQRAVRLPWLGPRLRAGRQAGPARPPGGAAAGRRRVRVLAAWSGTRWCATAFRSSR